MTVTEAQLGGDTSIDSSGAGFDVVVDDLVEESAAVGVSDDSHQGGGGDSSV